MQCNLNKVKRSSIISDDRSIADILDDIDYGLFKKKCSFPTIHYIFPNERSSLHGMKMRKRGNNYNLPILKTEIATKSFLNRMLFKYQ